MVPVLRDADKKSFAEIEKPSPTSAFAARDGKLGMEEMTGGTFTITNGGVYGSLMSTPISTRRNRASSACTRSLHRNPAR